MAKYDPLGEHLKKLPQTTTQITLTFEKVEEIIAARLKRGYNQIGKLTRAYGKELSLRFSSLDF